ncbi:hypothetical protein CN200_05665 [Sinorhizobium meliloti]|uniref:hypothetical protein n=1 Tax=Rhizobium meliloti TaxID=382 RepID=UPI000FD46B53|nr:hypothetical protein [Sinorhizobium meliloti]RVH21151.1 hypothetical protein CN216_02205 [Sinorhizobium meliloti]RVI18977.1 hypothetical protein CN200_05665 [Sinorhizobium meliloti]RVN91137.1 hypothetical protein CN107_08630 [Sinorhizobium meliloti]RVO14641.1 hypothetical protein CN103_06970 [Sinorhizobium meliloti]
MRILQGKVEYATIGGNWCGVVEKVLGGTHSPTVSPPSEIDRLLAAAQFQSEALLAAIPVVPDDTLCDRFSPEHEYPRNKTAQGS